jgi:transposase InsO family protein
MFHSDRGGQDTGRDFRAMLKDHSITASMSRCGDCWHSPCSETLFASLKVERLHGQSFAARRQGKDEANGWMLWYNKALHHPTRAYVSPMKLEQGWLANQPRPANSCLGCGVQIRRARSLPRIFAMSATHNTSCPANCC